MEGIRLQAQRAEEASPARRKALEAARQFEGLLIGQLIRGSREGSGGWLGAGEDGAGGIAAEYAEQHFAEALASQGGLGLARLAVEGLEPQR